MPQAVPFAQPAPVPIQPIMRRELIQSTGRINFNSPASCLANGDDLPCKSSLSTEILIRRARGTISDLLGSVLF